MTHDKKCFDLAASFLEDVGIEDNGVIRDLADEIQMCIEDFIEHFKDNQ